MDAPVELLQALAARPEAETRFQALSPSHQREYVEYVAEAKKPETRERRALKSVEMILAKSPSSSSR
jgi:uncharacterized protein YdeI (YjbR/CyaY-like superfamily)